MMRVKVWADESDGSRSNNATRNKGLLLISIAELMLGRGQNMGIDPRLLLGVIPAQVGIQRADAPITFFQWTPASRFLHGRFVTITAKDNFLNIIILLAQLKCAKFGLTYVTNTLELSCPRSSNRVSTYSPTSGCPITAFGHDTFLTHYLININFLALVKSPASIQ